MSENVTLKKAPAIFDAHSVGRPLSLAEVPGDGDSTLTPLTLLRRPCTMGLEGLLRKL